MDERTFYPAMAAIRANDILDLTERHRSLGPTKTVFPIVPRPAFRLLFSWSWEEKRQDYELQISEFAVSEAASRDPLMADRRLVALSGIAEIHLTKAATDLAEMVADGLDSLRAMAALDAPHIAVAVAGEMEFLLTRSFKHLAHATMRDQIERKCRWRGFEPPIIRTLEELSGK